MGLHLFFVLLLSISALRGEEKVECENDRKNNDDNNNNYDKDAENYDKEARWRLKEFAPR